MKSQDFKALFAEKTKPMMMKKRIELPARTATQRKLREKASLLQRAQRGLYHGKSAMFGNHVSFSNRK
jgi:hypothetical protein